MSNIKDAFDIEGVLNLGSLMHQLNYLNNEGIKLIVPVLIDYSPVMLLSLKPYYLCLYIDSNSECKLGYTTAIKYNQIAHKGIPYETLEHYLTEASFTKAMDCTGIEVPENAIISTEFLVNLGKSKLGSLNINTSHGSFLLKLIDRDYSTLNESQRDDLTLYLIRKQSRLDAFVRIVDNFSDDYKAISMLDGVCISSFNLYSDKCELDRIQSQLNVRPYRETLENIDLCRTNRTSTQVRRTDLKQEYYLETNVLEIPNISYKVTSMAVCKDDFGVDALSEIELYPVTKNEYLICLMCNDRIYRELYTNRLKSIYHTLYNTTQMSESIRAFFEDVSGTVSFKSIITGEAYRR